MPNIISDNSDNPDSIRFESAPTIHQEARRAQTRCAVRRANRLMRKRELGQGMELVQAVAKVKTLTIKDLQDGFGCLWPTYMEDKLFEVYSASLPSKEEPR